MSIIKCAIGFYNIIYRLFSLPPDTPRSSANRGGGIGAIGRGMGGGQAEEMGIVGPPVT